MKTGIFNHVSMYFSDVVWTGLPTQHVRKGFGSEVRPGRTAALLVGDQPGIPIWSGCGTSGMRSLLIWARHDTSFLPVYSRAGAEELSRVGVAARSVCLPCGHYTTGQFPFNLIDGLAMCRFAARNL